MSKAGDRFVGRSASDKKHGWWKGEKRCFFHGPCLVISFLCCDLSPCDVLVTAIETKAWDYFLGDGVVGHTSAIQLAIFSYVSSDGLVGETNLTKYFVSTCRSGLFSWTWLPSGLHPGSLL
ncbi:unnamed protein product [Ixodes pacificus]